MNNNVIYCIECGSACDKEARFCMHCGHKLEKASEEFTIKKYFNDFGLEYTAESDSQSTIPSILDVASFMVENYSYIYDFLNQLKWSINGNNTKCSYRYNKNNEEHIIKLVRKMENCFILNNVYIDKTASKVYCSVATTPIVINFLNGKYLEMYIQKNTENVLKEMAKKYNCDYEIAGNVHIHNDEFANELDHVFRLGNTMFWIEDKSGKNFDPNKSYNIGKKLKFIPNRFLMVMLTQSNQSCENLEYMYQCYASNGENFINKLRKMIDDNMKNAVAKTTAA